MTHARFGEIDVDAFCDELPGRARGHDLSRLKPLAFAVTDRPTFTLVPHADGLAVETGDEDAATVVALDHADWCDLVWELKSSFALLYADRLTFARGHFGHLAAWEPPLRAVLDDQAVYDLDGPEPVLAADGESLDLARTFTLAEDDSVIADHLARAGFVHLRGVLDTDEVEDLRAVVDAALVAATPDDGRSWWTEVDGAERCCRLNYLNERFEAVARLDDDPRFEQIGALGGPDLRPSPDRLDGHGVVIKVPGASTGLTDLPWHRDCGMGGHPVKCPMLNVGIQLDAATEATGRLEMIAGSHTGTSRLPGADEVGHLPVVAIDTDPGDVTVHFGHTLPAAPPPRDRDAAGRRALYLSYVPPITFEMVPDGRGYNDVLFTRDAGRVRHLDDYR